LKNTKEHLAVTWEENERLRGQLKLLQHKLLTFTEELSDRTFPLILVSSVADRIRKIINDVRKD